ncbi:glycoside hydrolase family 16 protein [Sphingobacterium wenxiniae]|uniref:glycoside hydrolase family 16 protein n=1 Tax=Sphingobacterium wenxiniae TaxID=683125 RepID=UPI0011133B4B|nr:glycoside hydrolase family 16 protein [Sphingobacterium wenxiniae]
MKKNIKLAKTSDLIIEVTMKYFIFLLLLLTLTACRKENLNDIENMPYASMPPPGYTLVWADEFDSPLLDAKKWNHRAPGFRRESFNGKEPVYVDTTEGALVINTFSRGDTVYTGMISTQGLFEAKHGYFECRAKIDTIFAGYWPAFWLQSRNIGKTLNPEVDGVEMDIMEFYNGNRFVLENALHWNGYGENQATLSNAVYSNTPYDEGRYHRYGMEWTENELRFFVDNRLIWVVKEPISKMEQYIILSTEVNNAALFKAVAGSGIKFYVDYVRVYAKDE